MRLGRSLSPRSIKSNVGGFFQGTPSQGSSTPTWERFPAVAEAAGKWAAGGNPEYNRALADAISGGQQGLDLARDLAFGGAGKNQYSLAARRWREEFMPGLTARGLATSGPGIDIEAQKLQEMAITQQAEGAKLLQDASKGLAMLQSMPFDMQQKIMAMIFGAPSTATETGSTPSLFSQLFPGGLKDTKELMK